MKMERVNECFNDCKFDGFIEKVATIYMTEAEFEIPEISNPDCTVELRQRHNFYNGVFYEIKVTERQLAKIMWYLDTCMHRPEARTLKSKLQSAGDKIFGW